MQHTLDTLAFQIDTRGDYCCVDTTGYGTVVIIRNPSSLEVQVYRVRTDDYPMDSMIFPKEDFDGGKSLVQENNDA
jgi:hypothetical protein